MQRRWLDWQIGMESKGLKVNIGKMEVMVSSRRGTKANIKDSQGTSLRQVNKFKYLGVTISEERGSEEAVRARVSAVSAVWGKWRDQSGVISDKKMPRKLKMKLYMTVIRPVLLYGAECWTVRKKEEQILEKTEMRMLQRIKGVTLRDKVKSVDIRKELGVTSIQEKVREMRLRWYEHMQRMEENNEVRAVVGMRGPGKRPRGDQEGDGWIVSKGISRHCGSPQRMPRTEHSGNQEFGPPSGKRRKKKYIYIYVCTYNIYIYILLI